ncbi:hypothetical protein ACF08M_04500 [Streptomyces sp. NPDC015032]|uniref:hypothetical protein n=1 Tax=Streptomyces sp. NPDC015032 TaxID=3364937 RepID=UPI0036FCFF85
MGWTVLYIAFGIVALWLLGEVLLQYKARLRWRLLAFAGFGCVVVGVLIPSVIVIAVGAIAFATGQTYVTLSFRRGFSTGWAIGGRPGASRRRRGGGGRESREPKLEVSGLEMEHDERIPERADTTAASSEAPGAAVYAPEPLPDDTGQYGVYHAHQRSQQGPGGQMDQQPQYAAYDPYANPSYPAPGQDSFGGQDSFAGQGQGQGQYDYGTGEQQYAAYSDPYIGTGATGGSTQYAPYDGYGNGYDGPQQYAADPHAQQHPETPPGGVWVPQQREGEQYPSTPAEQPAQPTPYPNGYGNGNGNGNGNGYDEQQHRY